jgi:hypothetical protein
LLRIMTTSLFVPRLPADEGVQRPARRSSTEQVDAAPAELARARAGEHEPDVPLLDEAMDLVEQDGQLLDLVEHDQPVLRPELLAELCAGRRLKVRKTSASRRS